MTTYGWIGRRPTLDDVGTPAAAWLQAADASLTVLSNTAFVTDWARRYFGSWWNAFDSPASGVCSGPLVTAGIDEKASRPRRAGALLPP